MNYMPTNVGRIWFGKESMLSGVRVSGGEISPLNGRYCVKVCELG